MFFSSLEDIRRMLRNQCLCIDNVDQCLAHVENFFVNDYASGDLRDPMDDSA